MKHQAPHHNSWKIDSAPVASRPFSRPLTNQLLPSWLHQILAEYPEVSCCIGVPLDIMSSLFWVVRGLGCGHGPSSPEETLYSRQPRPSRWSLLRSVLGVGIDKEASTCLSMDQKLLLPFSLVHVCLFVLFVYRSLSSRQTLSSRAVASLIHSNLDGLSKFDTCSYLPFYHYPSISFHLFYS